MIKNIELKLFIANIVFRPLGLLNKVIRHDKQRILLYSNLGFRDNIKALYDFLIEKEYNRKYKIICCTNDYSKYLNIHIDNVFFYSDKKGLLEYFKCGFVYYCFGKIPIIPGRGQEVIQMWHGSPFKAPDEAMLKTHSFKRLYYTHIFTSSEFYKPIWHYCFSFPEDKMIVCGHPRTDVMFKGSPNYNFGKYDKLVLWVPTFRGSKELGYTNGNKNVVVPIFKMEELNELNSKLRSLNIKLVIKLHPMQDLSAYHLISLDYLVLLSNQEMDARNMELYGLCAQADAMITDYSSIFLDYIQLNRPLAFTEDDEADYCKSRGYVFDNPNSFKAGHIIKTKNDFYDFLTDLKSGIDIYESERLRVRSLSNTYCDGANCRRALISVGINL